MLRFQERNITSGLRVDKAIKRTLDSPEVHLRILQKLPMRNC
jgi:hypothetical protein